nr:uncharacterized protein LOC121126879 [Lepeophtheirus salmonis]
MGYFQSQFLPIIVLLLGIISIQSGVSLPMNETMQEESPSNHLRCQLSESICSFSCLFGGYKTGLCIPNENGEKLAFALTKCCRSPFVNQIMKKKLLLICVLAIAKSLEGKQVIVRITFANAQEKDFI